MKRCPKCNRTFPDDNQKFCTIDGGLLVAQPAFDPHATIQSTPLDTPSSEPYRDKATSRELPDMGTIAAASAPTAVFPQNTGPTSLPTSSSLPPTSEEAAPATVVGARPPKKRSKLPLILGVLALLLLLGIGGVAAVFFFVIKPRLEREQERSPVVTQTNQNENTNNSVNAEDNQPKPESEFVPPPDGVKFSNSKDNLEGKLAEHYLDFSFYYPKNWQTDPKTSTSNFVKVQKMLDDPTGEYLLESATFSWYASNGSFESDLPIFPERAHSYSSQLSDDLPGYEKVSEGETQINSIRGYDFGFKGVFRGTGKGDLAYWGRTIFLPPRDETEKNGVVIVLLATSLAPELSGVEDVGEKGEMPIILESFRFGRNR